MSRFLFSFDLGRNSQTYILDESEELKTMLLKIKDLTHMIKETEGEMTNTDTNEIKDIPLRLEYNE